MSCLGGEGFSKYPGTYGPSAIHIFDSQYSIETNQQTKFKKYTNLNVVIYIKYKLLSM